MKVFRKGNLLRFGLTAVLLGMLVCVGVLLFSWPGADRMELIPADMKAVEVMDLRPGESFVQPVYIYRDFDGLTLIRSGAGAESVIGLEITRNDQPFFSGEIVFPAGESEYTLDLPGEKGTLVLRMVNCGDAPLSLPLVAASRYDIGDRIASEEPLLQIGVYRRSGIAKGTFAAAALIFFFLALALLWGWGRGWTRRKAVLFILIVCLGYFLLFPAWNVNDFGMHFLTSWSYANTLLGAGPDERDLFMVREDDAELLTYVLNDRSQSFFQPTAKSYDDAVTYLFRRTERNQMIPFERDNSVHRENGIWSYLPYVLGILIARLLSLNLVSAVFLARLCGLAFCVAGIGLALRKLPEKLTVPFTILSCVPVCAMNLGAVSYDGPCYVVVLCFFAYVAALREPYRQRDAILLVFCSLALSLVKRGAYTPFILSLPLFLSGRDNRKKRLIRYCILAAAVGLLYNYRNVLLGRISLHTFTSEGWDTYDAKWALQHPLHYLVLMVRSCLRQTDQIYGVVGRYLGWNKAVIPEFICGLFYLLLFLSAMLPDQETGRIRPFSRPEKVWICLPVVVLILLLPTTMLSYTFLSSEIIDGPQGRYYLPLLVPLLLLCGYNLRKKIVLKSDETALLLGGTSALHLISVYYLALVFLRA